MDELIISKLATQIAELSVEVSVSKVQAEVSSGQVAYLNKVLDSDEELRKLFTKAEKKLLESEVQA